jgi:SAM-dependent methyltransferase
MAAVGLLLLVVLALLIPALKQQELPVLTQLTEPVLIQQENAIEILQKKPEVPYVSTPDEVVAEMIKMADVGRDDVVYDLGCGDGRIVITAVKETGCRGVGIDIDPVRIKESKENAIEAGVEDKVEFILSDLFEADISQATVVTLYLLSKVNLRLRPKLFRELSPGTRVVSHDFDMGGWDPENSKFLNGDRGDVPIAYDPFEPNSFVLGSNWDRHSVYLWIMPANANGVWKWTLPKISDDMKYSLEIEQTFQEIEAKAYVGSSAIPLSIKDGKMRADKLEFAIERPGRSLIDKIHFVGVVKGHIMEGFFRVEGKPGLKEKWRAERVLSTFKPINIPAN